MKREEFEFEKYINDRVQDLVNQALQVTRTNLQANMFLAKFARAEQGARTLREKSAQMDVHIPPMIVADIEDRESKGKLDVPGMKSKDELLKVEEWLDVFQQAEDMGVSFIVLRGSDPLLCQDVIKAAGRFAKILFPIITDGERLDDSYVKYIDKHRNLFPVFRLKSGNIFREIYESKGIFSDYDPVVEKMDVLLEHRIIFGVAIHVTADNLDEVTQKEYLNKLYDRGCRAVFYINFVSGRRDNKELELEESGQKFLNKQLRKLHDQYMGMLFYLIPEGDKGPGGCMAAARGFLHITAIGDVQPCPVAHFHDRNIRVHSLKESVQSTFFRHLQESHLLEEEMDGVCPLAGKEAVLKLILR